MKRYLPCAALIASLVFAGCAGTATPPATQPPPRTGFNTDPEGPVVTGIHAAVMTATATPNGKAFMVTFPAERRVAQPKATVTFSFDPVDINDRIGMAIDIRNRGTTPATVYADLNDDTWVRGYVTVPAERTGTLYVFARRKKLSAEATEKFPGMHGIPGGKMSLWAGIEEPIVARDLKLFVVLPPKELRLEVSDIRPFGSSKIPDRPDLFPFIDAYGQYLHKEWPGKIHSDDDFAAGREREAADLKAQPGAPDRDKFGGWAAGPQLKATGHFRVEKVGGKWWLVDPEGRLFWASGLDMVGFTQSSTRTQGRERFYAQIPPNGFLAHNLQLKYGENWRDVAGDLLLQRTVSWGMNTLGGGADRNLTAKGKVPYTALLGSARGMTIDPDSPAWVESLRRSLTAAAQTMKDDPWCIGFFVDNEIHVTYDPVWWEKYYRQVSAAAKEIMPDKLYLGSRLDYHDWPDVEANKHEIVKLAARYCDVISFNFYKFTLDDVVLPEGVDRPAIIGEFHFGALDRGQFHTGLRSVVDQNHRAEAYRNYVTSAARNPAFVGALWFQCYDESTTGRFDGENYQIGFLDIGDTPYPETVAAAREVGYKLYSIRAGK